MRQFKLQISVFCMGCVSTHPHPLMSAVKGDRATLVFVRPGDILQICLLMKMSVASKQIGLQTIMTPLWKYETLTDMMVFSVLLYNPRGTRLKSVPALPISVCSNQTVCATH